MISFLLKVCAIYFSLILRVENKVYSYFLSVKVCEQNTKTLMYESLH